MKSKKTKNLLTRLCACVMVFAMCMSLVTVPAIAATDDGEPRVIESEAELYYNYTVNYKMSEPVLKGNGAPIYWSEMTTGGYEFVDDNEEGYGEKLRLTNSGATLGLSGASGDIYSVSFDMKFTGTASSGNTTDIYLRNWSSGNVNIGFMRVTEAGLQLSTNGAYSDYSETANSKSFITPYNKGEWNRIEYIVHKAAGTAEWYVNGKKVGTSTAPVGYNMAFFNIACSGDRSKYVVEFDNIKTATLSKIVIPDESEAYQYYDYTVNYEMNDPVPKGNGAPIYWSEMATGGYEFALDNVPGYGKKLRLTNSGATLGLSGASGDIYSVRYDMKFTGTASSGNTTDIYLRNWSSGNVNIGFMRVTEAGLQLSTNGAYSDYSETANSKSFITPYNKGEWNRIEYIVHKTAGTAEWYVNGKKVGTSTAPAGYNMAFFNISCTGDRSNYVVEFDNVRTATLTAATRIVPVDIGVTAGTSYEDAVKKLPIAFEVKVGANEQLIPVIWNAEAGEYNASQVGTTKICGVLDTDLVENKNVYATVTVAEALPVLEGTTKLTQFIPHSTAASMGYLIETKGGKFIGIDGGIDWTQTPAAAQDDDFLFKYLQKVTGKAHPVIEAWFLTHFHNDHMDAFSYMLQNHKDEITVNNVYFDLPSDEWIAKFGQTWEGNSATYVKLKNALNHFYGEADYMNTVHRDVKMGDMIAIDDVVFDVILTPNGTEERMNETSIVLRMSVDQQDTIFLADLENIGGNRLVGLYGDKLKCDILQMAHHGQAGVGKNVYEKTMPELCLWPAADWIYNDSLNTSSKECTWSYITKAWMEELGLDNHIIAGIDGSKTIEIPYTVPEPEMVDQYTVNYEMTEPVLKGEGSIYWTDMADGGYAFVDENELGYGKKLRLTNSSATLGLSGASGDVYSLSFDMKFTGAASDGNTTEIYMRNWDSTKSANVNIGFMRVTDSMLQFSTYGNYVGYSEDKVVGNFVVTPYEKGKWNNIEYVVNKTAGTTEWYVNGKKVGEGTAPAGWGISWANISCTGEKSNYVVEIDNVKTATIAKAVSKKDDALLVGSNDFENGMTGGKGLWYADEGGAVLATDDTVHNKVVKIDNGKAKRGNITIHPSTNSILPQLVGIDSWVLSYDIKVDNNTPGFISYFKMNGKKILPMIFFKNEANAAKGVVGIGRYTYTESEELNAEISGDALKASNNRYNIAEYNLGEWLSIDVVVKGKTAYTYINGKLVSTTGCDGFGDISTISWSNGVFFYSTTADTIDAYIDNLKLTKIDAGAFFYTAKADNGKIVLDFTQGISNIDANGIKLLDKDGNEVAKTVAFSGHNVVITPKKALGYYKVEMPEHTMGAAGYVLAERTAEVTAPVFEVVNAEIAKSGNAATFNVTYENGVAQGKELWAIIAAYEGGALKAVDFVEHSVAGSLTEAYTPENKPTITVPETADEIKAFIWTKDSCKPVISPVIE